MRSLRCLLIWLCLPVLSGCSFVVEGKCTSCGSPTVFVTGTGCTAGAAYEDAKSQCGSSASFTATGTELAFGIACLPELASVNAATIVAHDALQVGAEKLGGVRDQNAASSEEDSCPAGGFTVKFTNERSSFCTMEFPVQIRVDYSDTNGTARAKTGSASAGQTTTLVMADAGSAQGGVSAFTIRVNTSCHANPSEEDWSVLEYGNGTVSHGATLTFLLNNEDNLTETTPPPSTAPRSDNVLPSKPVLIPIPDPMFSKN